MEMTDLYLGWYVDESESVFDRSGIVYGTLEEVEKEVNNDFGIYRMSQEGVDFLGQWLEDDSLGYDLCNGRAKGLAAEYTKYQAWEHIISNNELSEKVQ